MFKSVVMPIVGKLVLQPAFRLTRGMTLGVRAAVRDGEGRYLVVRQTYTNGWIFPGGGVERGEGAVQALRREVVEEAGVTITGEPALFGLFSNHIKFSGDYVALYVSDSFEQGEWKPNAEISDRQFLSPDEIARDCSPAMQRRLGELSGKTGVSEHW